MATNYKIEPLGKENYDTWKIQAQALLTKNKSWSYVTGQSGQPHLIPGDQTTAKLVADWIVKDSDAIADLILIIAPNELKKIKGYTTSRELWKKIETIYSSKGPARKASLYREIAHSRMKDDDDAREYLCKFFTAVDKLRNMNVDVSDELLVIMLLSSLPDSYENFRVAIETRDVLPTPEVLQTKLEEEYDTRKSKIADTNSAFTIDKYKKKSYNRPRKDKDAKTFNDSKSKEKPKSKCPYCHKGFHWESDCRTKMRDNAQPHESAASVLDDLFAVDDDLTPFQEAALLSMNKPQWCLDSGATSHMCAQADAFRDSQPTPARKLRLANSQLTKVNSIGTVPLVVQDDKSG